MPCTLPLDILPIIFSHLSIPDIRQVRVICKDFYYTTKTHTLWYTYIHHNLLANNIPIPGLNNRSLQTIDASELEHLSIKAEHYKHNWSLPNPLSTKEETFVAVPTSGIIALKFLSRNSYHWLLSVALTRSNGLKVFTFQCWDVKKSPPVCIARRIFHQFFGLAFNQSSSGKAVYAVRTTDTLLIDVDPTVGNTPPQACVTIASIKDNNTVGSFFLVGDYILSQDPTGRVFFYQFEQPERRVELIDNETGSFHHQPERILVILVDYGCIILSRERTLEVYALPRVITSDGMKMEILAKHKWQWKVDSLKMKMIRPVGSCNDNFNLTESRPRPLHIALRFGSIHPWPVNLIHRYMLEPNELFNADRETSKGNLPYTFIPIMLETISSPIRLMAAYDMVIGSRGTIMYIDSHTEGYIGYAELGQRLAGSRFSEGWNGDKDENEDGDGNRKGEGKLEREEELNVDSMVMNSEYRFVEVDEWNVVALDEEEGKIAIGHLDGRIKILDYA